MLEKPEEWRPVANPIYSANYEVSDHGRVRRSTPGRGRAAPGRLLSQARNASGHLRVTLWPYQKFMVHRLVLEAFVGPRPDGMEACHNDNDPSNNRPTNLRWDTRSANHYDRVGRGAKIRGEGNGRAKLTPEQITKILTDPRTAASIAREFGVHEATICRVRRGESWKGSYANNEGGGGSRRS